MALNDPNGKFILDLNNETFKENFLGCKSQIALTQWRALKKLRLLIWSQVYAAI
jgi:hypothetical protein